ASQGADFQHQGLYPRSNYSEQPFSCSNAQGSAGQPRGHGQEQSGPASHFPGPAEHCPPPPMSNPRACSQQPALKPPNGSAVKQPAVVYPWMKKVHVNSVNPNYNGGEPKRSRTAYTRQQVLELEKE
ncbi:HXD4 protein, partial [Spizella passerina]|nr:HXD4 protein [Spizella passerina]